MGGGSGVGGFEEDTLSPHPLQQTEEAFLEGVLGGGAKPPLQRTTSAWGEAQQLRAARRELSLVVDARLGRCVEACTRETASAAELRAALKAAAAAADVHPEVDGASGGGGVLKQMAFCAKHGLRIIVLDCSGRLSNLWGSIWH